MRTRVLKGVQIALLPTIGLAFVLVALPARAELTVHVWLLAMLTTVLGGAIATLRSAYPDVPSAFDGPSSGGSEPQSLEGLTRAEREIALSMSSAFDAHLRLRPALQEVATGLLASRRGVDLERQPDRARALLGEETWELVRPDRPPPERRHGGGIEADDVDRVLSSLEQL